jgi:hypothetical protein
MAVKIHAIAAVEAHPMDPFCRFWTKLRVLVLCFPDFTENSNIHEERTDIIEC